MIVIFKTAFLITESCWYLVANLNIYKHLYILIFVLLVRKEKFNTTVVCKKRAEETRAWKTSY